MYHRPLFVSTNICIVWNVLLIISAITFNIYTIIIVGWIFLLIVKLRYFVYYSLHNLRYFCICYLIYRATSSLLGLLFIDHCMVKIVRLRPLISFIPLPPVWSMSFSFRVSDYGYCHLLLLAWRKSSMQGWYFACISKGSSFQAFYT